MKKGINLLLSLVMVLSIISSVSVTTSAASVSDLTFELNVDGKSYCVADCKESASGTLAIPAIYNGLPVTSLSNYAFYNCKNLTSVTIPYGVTSIGDSNDLEGGGVFMDCTNLSSITIPDSVASIGCYSFYNTAYYNDNSNWENGVLYIGKHLVAAKNSSNNICTIKEGTKTIAACAFEFISGLTSVTIPDGVVSIGCRAFFDCRLTSVTIPESVTEIGSKALGYFWGSGDSKIKNFTIYGVQGSTAELYAKQYGFKFIKINCKHETTEWIVDKKATVYTPGLKHQNCIDCGEKIKTEEIPQLKCATPKLKSVTNTATGVKITWNKVDGADSYTVMRKTGTGSWKAIKGSLKTTYYTDKTAKSGVTYKYTVKAKNEAGFSGYNTNGLSIKCLADPTLKAPKSSKAGITLNWSKVTGSQGYVIYRKAGNGKFVNLTTVKGASKVSYVDKNAKKGTKYTYKLKAYSGKTYSAFSNGKTIKDKY